MKKKVFFLLLFICIYNVYSTEINVNRNGTEITLSFTMDEFSSSISFYFLNNFKVESNNAIVQKGSTIEINKINIPSINAAGGKAYTSYKLGNVTLEEGEKYVINENKEINFNIILKFLGIELTDQSIKLYEFHIDSTPPTVPAINLNGYNSGKWTNQDVIIDLSKSTDSESGFSHYDFIETNNETFIQNIPEYAWQKLENNQYQTNVEDNKVFEKYLYFRAVDNVGNKTEVLGPVIVRIDKIAPELSTGNYTTGWSKETVIITATDDNSKVKKLEINSQSYNLSKYTLNQTGTYTAKAIDNAGNESESKNVVLI